MIVKTESGYFVLERCDGGYDHWYTVVSEATTTDAAEAILLGNFVTLRGVYTRVGAVLYNNPMLEWYDK